MRLVEKEFCYIIEDVFPSSVIAGWTKPVIEGKLPQDAQKVLSFIEGSKVSYLNQAHSAVINFVHRQGVYEGDGLFSDEKNLALVVKTADCLPIFFCNLENESIGIVHMGWRGAALGILDNIGSNLSKFIAVAGVGLRKCCYKVGGDFQNHLRIRAALDKRDCGLYFDPVKFVKEKLSMYKMPSLKILDLNICSFCSRDNFFSYRRGAVSQRTLSFIVRRG